MSHSIRMRATLRSVQPHRFLRRLIGEMQGVKNHTVPHEMPPLPKTLTSTSGSRIPSPLSTGVTLDAQSRASTRRYRATSQPKIGQTGMIVRTATERPVVQAIRFANRQVVDARVAMRHQAVFVELPVFVPV